MANLAITTGLAAITALGLAVTGVVQAGVAYPNPAGGWVYTYTGVGDDFGNTLQQEALDGTWGHGKADQWDGSAPGDPATGVPNLGDGPGPGGAVALTDGGDGTTYLRIQDAGEPTQYGWFDPSNKKVYFDHDMQDDIADLDPGVLDNGITISFRARLVTPAIGGPLDEQYQEGFAEPLAWPEEGKGYPISNHGRAMFNVWEESEFSPSFQVAGFSLITSTESGEFGLTSGGLVMNNLVGPTPTSAVDTGDPGDKNLLPIDDADLADWHEFWITIQLDPTETGTHQVDVYVDGSAEKTTFFITAGANDDVSPGAHLGMGLSSGTRLGAVDIDSFSYTLGVIPPQLLGDVNLDGSVNGLDVQPFVDLVTGASFQEEADMNGDGAVNGLDVSPFVDAVLGSGAAAVPEPSTLALGGLALLVLGGVVRRWRW